MRLDQLSAAEAVAMAYSKLSPGASLDPDRLNADVGVPDYDWRIVDGFEVSRIIEAVRSCDPVVQDWILWAHTGEPEGGKRGRLLQALVDRLDVSDRDLRKIGRALKMVSLADALIVDWKADSGGRRGTRRLAKVIGVNESTLRSRGPLGMVKREVEDIFQEYENIMSLRVGMVLDAMQEEYSPYMIPG